MKTPSLFFVLSALPGLLSAQYSNHEQLAARIKKLEAATHLVSATTLAVTPGGHEIFLIRAGTGDADSKPAVAVCGGSDGSLPYTTEVVMQMAERLVAQHPDVLGEVTFYFLPNLSPDATEQYFTTLRYERIRNRTPNDDDRDGLTDEDGYDDLNGDGMITRMRVADPVKGDYIVHPGNPAVMVKADVTRGEHGEYLLLTEGFDNDKDGRINEDLPGGTLFNRNFSFHYPYFGEAAGENAFSEPETRAVAQFLFDHWNIYAVLCVGRENNLTEYNDLAADLADKSIPAAVQEKDKPFFESVVHAYKNRVHLSDSAKVNPAGGDLLSWAYFHYNRFAFSTPAWNVAKDKNDRGSAEYDYLKWATARNLPDASLPWKAVSHPDFPGQTVEVGGILPFAACNPPLAYLDTAAMRHVEFLSDLGAMHPALQFNRVKVTPTGKNVFLIEAEITNTGRFPTMTSLAVNSRWVKKIRLEITPGRGQTVAGGRRIFLFDRILPGETVKSSWLVTGKGTVTLSAGSPQTGTTARDVELK
jgi:hypothetical protein